MVPEFIRVSKLPLDAKILDIGCGKCYTLDLFRKKGFRNLEGISCDQVELDACHSKGIVARNMDMTLLQYPPSSFDAVWARHSLEHSFAPYFVMFQIYQILKPGGFFYLEVPLPDTPSKHQENKNHYSVLGISQWQSLASRLGFVQFLDYNLEFPLPNIGPEAEDKYWAAIFRKNIS
ncbi:unnamed protein product [Heterosigma akashiwo]